MLSKIKGQLVGVIALLATGVSSVQAAVPAEVTTALTDAKADAITVAGTVLVIIIAISAFLYMRRAAK